MRKSFLTFFTILLLSSSLRAQASDFIYNDGFIWFISGRLASNKVDSLSFGEQKYDELPPDLKFQFFQDLKHIYHQQLISCSSPLPAISKALKGLLSENLESLPPSNVLDSIGELEREYWPIVQKWAIKNDSDILRIFKSGKYAHLPSCTILGYEGPWKKSCQCPK